MQYKHNSNPTTYKNLVPSAAQPNVVNIDIILQNTDTIIHKFAILSQIGVSPYKTYDKIQVIRPAYGTTWWNLFNKDVSSFKLRSPPETVFQCTNQEAVLIPGNVYVFEVSSSM